MPGELQECVSKSSTAMSWQYEETSVHMMHQTWFKLSATEFNCRDQKSRAMDLRISAVFCLLLVPAISTSEAEIDLQHVEEVLHKWQPDALPILEELKKDKKDLTALACRTQLNEKVFKSICCNDKF
ncbi:unnamed protein product [Caenorhabditis nigoni]